MSKIENKIKELEEQIKLNESFIKNYYDSFPTKDLQSTWSGMMKYPIDSEVKINYYKREIERLKSNIILPWDNLDES